VQYVIAVIAAILLGIGFVFQQDAASRAPSSHFLRLRLIAELIRQPRWLAGLVTMVAGELLSAWVVGNVVLSLAEPLLATNLLFALVLAVPLSRQALTRAEAAGAVVLMLGVAALSLARSAQGAQISIGSASYWPYAGGAALAAAAWFAELGRRHSGAMRATLTGTSAGIVFGIQDALTRKSVDLLEDGHIHALLTTWPGYCLIASGAVGVWLMQGAFNAAPLHASLPAMTAGEPVVGIALGIVVFGDSVHISGGLIALQLAGLAALIIGVIMVARSPTLSGLRVRAPAATVGRGRDRAPAGSPAPNPPGTADGAGE